jgi:Fe-S-cluster containining protein
MNLPVIPDDTRSHDDARRPSDPAAPSAAAADPWYARGLDFTCTTCGNCCTGGPGFVWVTDEEIERMAGHLALAVPEFRRRYTRRVTGKVSLKEVRRPNGLHDCVFLTELPAVVPPGAGGTDDQAGDAGGRRELAPGEPVPLGRRVCGVYPVRPLQCRTWPFWPENLRTKASWHRAAKGCPGMNRGGRHFTREQAEAIRDANAWPVDPPASADPEPLAPRPAGETGTA